MPRIVDIHPHIVSSDRTRYPVSPIGGRQSTWSVERPASFEDLAAQMEANGVGQAAIVQSSTVYGFDNSYVADVVAGNSERFVGVFSVNVRSADPGKAVRYWLSKPGMVGLRIYTAGSTLPGQAFSLDDPLTYGAWSAAAESGIPVCVGMTFKAMPELGRIMKRFPSVRIILDHLGHPSLDGGPPYTDLTPLVRLVELGRLFLKLTPVVIRLASQGSSTASDFLEWLVGRVGAERIAWGSNYPNSSASLADLLRQCQEATASLQTSEQEMIFGGTALTLYPTLR